MKKLLLKIARTPCLGSLVGWMIAHLSRFLPLHVIHEDENCIVFRHPAPSYPFHLLIMLKAQVRDVSRADEYQLRCVFDAARSAIQTAGLSAPHIMLWTNGGRFQEVRQLHFHLFPSDPDREAGLRELRRIRVGQTEVRECIRGDGANVNLLILHAGAGEFVSVLPRLIDQYNLNARGYSVFRDLSPDSARGSRICVHIG